MNEQGTVAVGRRPANVVMVVSLLAILIALILAGMTFTGWWVSRNGDPLLGVFSGDSESPFPVYMAPSRAPVLEPVQPGLHMPREQSQRGLG